MRINSANLGMESARNYSSFSFKQAAVSTGTVIATGMLGLNQKDEETFEESKNSLRERLNEMSSYSEIRMLSHLKNQRDSYSTIREQCMQYLTRLFFKETEKMDYEEMLTQVQGNQFSSGQVKDVIYSHQESYFYEEEDTSFSTEGTVVTADGREITIHVDVQMSRSFSEYYEENYLQIQDRMCDPLVINLDTDVTNLSDQTFYFDLDADGEKDEISRLARGSGFLALDKNGDGRINDGNDLFGAKSGNGFSDLAAYDSDGNDWIDENDEIWKKLLIWTKDESGSDKCYKLSEKGVGAICLSNQSTDFSLNSDENKANGRIRRTGIFLYENGYAGTIQHVDMTLHGNQTEHFEAVG